MLLVYLGNWRARRREHELLQRPDVEAAGFPAPRPFSSIYDEELESFHGVFIPGGHAPISDLGANPELGRILCHFHARHKATGMS